MKVDARSVRAYIAEFCKECRDQASFLLAMPILFVAQLPGATAEEVEVYVHANPGFSLGTIVNRLEHVVSQIKKRMEQDEKEK